MWRSDAVFFVNKWELSCKFRCFSQKNLHVTNILIILNSAVYAEKTIENVGKWKIILYFLYIIICGMGCDSPRVGHCDAVRSTGTDKSDTQSPFAETPACTGSVSHITEGFLHTCLFCVCTASAVRTLLFYSAVQAARKNKKEK